MVLRRGDTRHKDVPFPLEAIPKRTTTIHAQRKFAQGSGMNGPAMSPIKERSKINGSGAEPSSVSTSSAAIPAKRPRTEDFITFLCYRGTTALPPALNSFNVASKPEKNEREIVSSAGSSKQNFSVTRQDKDESKVKSAKQKKRIVMRSKSKVLDQRQRKTRINASAQKASKLVKRAAVQPAISKERLKKVAVILNSSVRNQLKARPTAPVARASHPAILKRLGASRSRAGLRSGGQLPPGSDDGIKTDRKPRSHHKIVRSKRQFSTKRKGQSRTPVRMKARRDAKKVPDPALLSPRSKLGSTSSKGNVLNKSAHPKSLSLAIRPSRKTKEAATLYMEMITKDLRTLYDDDDDDDDDGDEDEDEEDIRLARSPALELAPVLTRTRSKNVDSMTMVSPSQVKSGRKSLTVETKSTATRATRSSLPTPFAGARGVKSAMEDTGKPLTTAKGVGIKKSAATGKRSFEATVESDAASLSEDSEGCEQTDAATEKRSKVVAVKSRRIAPIAKRTLDQRAEGRRATRSGAGGVHVDVGDQSTPRSQRQSTRTRVKVVSSSSDEDDTEGTLEASNANRSSSLKKEETTVQVVSKRSGRSVRGSVRVKKEECDGEAKRSTRPALSKMAGECQSGSDKPKKGHEADKCTIPRRRQVTRDSDEGSVEPPKSESSSLEDDELAESPDKTTGVRRTRNSLREPSDDNPISSAQSKRSRLSTLGKSEEEGGELKSSSRGRRSLNSTNNPDTPGQANEELRSTKKKRKTELDKVVAPRRQRPEAKVKTPLIDDCESTSLEEVSSEAAPSKSTKLKSDESVELGAARKRLRSSEDVLSSQPSSGQKPKVDNRRGAIQDVDDVVAQKESGKRRVRSIKQGTVASSKADSAGGSCEAFEEKRSKVVDRKTRNVTNKLENVKINRRNKISDPKEIVRTKMSDKDSEAEQDKEEARERPRRKRAVVKRESYSEFSDNEEYDAEVPPPRTRGRKSYVKYTENDTDDTEAEQVEKRPKRTRRSVLPITVDFSSDDDDERHVSDEDNRMRPPQVNSSKLADNEPMSSETPTDVRKIAKKLSSNEIKEQVDLMVSEAGSSTDQRSIPNSRDSKVEPKRVVRRLSKENDVNGDGFPVKLAGSGEALEEKVTECHVTHDFSAGDHNKGNYTDNDGLATLADVAFSELQNRKNIMGRKLSSDSATSLSSDDILLPVSKEKVLPKSKADLPTVREKTESDEAISDVGNDETDDGSSFDEYRKADKQPRRKRLPRKTRKEPAEEIPSQRPLRSRRAKLIADSYVDDESFSSDHSSGPESAMVTKPSAQKNRRKSHDNIVTAPSTTVPLATSPLASTVKEPKPSHKEQQSAERPKEGKLLPTSCGKAAAVDLHIKPKDKSSRALLGKRPADGLSQLSPPTPSLSIPLVDSKNNNSVTLFSGVSGVTLSRPENMNVSTIPPQKVRAPPPQIGLNYDVSTRRCSGAPGYQQPFAPGRSSLGSSQPHVGRSNLAATEAAKTNSAKPNIGDTWKNAFKNAKIPKPGQLSPAHHSSVGTPFVRKPFSSSPQIGGKQPLDDGKTNVFQPTKLPVAQTFKSSPSYQILNKLGGHSPSQVPGGSSSPGKLLVTGSPEVKQHVYLSPVRVKSSPSKSEDKLAEATPTKSLTLLQYEKRSQNLISSLKGSQPILVDGSATFVPAFPSKLKEFSMEKARAGVQVVANKSLTGPPPPAQPPIEDSSRFEAGKHLNLPFAVEQAFRKRSPITVKKPTKPAEKKAGPSMTIPEVPSGVLDRPAVEATSSALAGVPTATTNLELLSKKKVQMTNEEIKKWLDDNTSSGVEHARDCGIFENNQCECSYRTSGESMMNSGVAELAVKKEDSKIDHGVVEPPVQLKELDTADKFMAETISTCKVEDYKEKMMSTAPVTELKREAVVAPVEEIKREVVVTPIAVQSIPCQKPRKPDNLTVDKAKRKSSMTEDEMCEFDFRFERNSNSPRESGSERSSPTPKDDVSSSNDDKFDGGAERKSIFHPRRPCVSGVPKRPALSKSPSAFSAENESSVYAFEPDAPPPTLDSPFRRRGSRNKSSEEDVPTTSSSIAVQVNLESGACSGVTVTGTNPVESEQVLECSTQTEQVDNEGQLFYFPLAGDNNPQEVIQGVQVKLHSTEGPEQKVIMKAKLVTKLSVSSSSTQAARPLSEVGRASQRPEQKVRPLSSTSTASQVKPPPVNTVPPTVRDVVPGCSSTRRNVSLPELALQSSPTAPPPAAGSTSLPVSSHTKADSALPPATGKSITSVAPAPRRCPPNGFPVPGSTPRMIDAPTFYPTDKEFQDPLDYIEQITQQAQSFGICRIVPPSSFKPECKVSDDMRFTAYNQYVHKMLYRWGPNVREMTAIKKYLSTQSIVLKQPPWIGGVEIDLPRLYQTVQSCGGLKEVIEKKRWAKVADLMKIPKAAQDRVTKLDDIYCKFLLPYDTLSHSERSKLLEEVDAEWTERERRIALEAERESKGEKEEKDDNSESEEESDDGRDECITKGRTMPLSGFYRIARNTMAMWFREPNPSAKEVENEYWKQVTSRKQHVCVNSGSIDSGGFGYGFPTSKSSSTSRHPWNLKVLTNNSGSILRSMGPLMGVTVPTLHVGMLFSACCWYRDPHGLPWIEYIHTGANKIWYAVPDLWNEELHGAMRTVLPRYCQDKPIWLASDTAMVPPDLLVQQGVSLCRAVQEPGQFILVFPKAFTSTICTGYIVSESVYFAQPSWLTTAFQIFRDIQDSCEPPAFSFEKLLFNIATDIRSSAEVLTQVLPMVAELRDVELKYRQELADLGVTKTERLAVTKGRKKSQEELQEYECEICRGNLYLSLVTNTVEEANFCLLHSVETLTKDRSHVKNCKLRFSYDKDEMDEVLEKIKQRIETKSCKKLNSKSVGGSSKS